MAKIQELNFIWLFFSIMLLASIWSAFSSTVSAVDLSDDFDDRAEAEIDSETESGRAHLLLRQQILSEYLSEGVNLTIKYTAINVGDLEATDIKVSIPTWPNDLFETIEGDITTTRSRLLPGENFSHTFTVKPKKSFKLLAVDSRAQIEYRYGSNDPPIEKVGKSSGFKNIDVMTLKEYQKLTMNHLDESKYFIAGSTAMVVIPLMMYYCTRLRFYELKSKIR